MIVYVDAESKIRAVNTTTDESLKPLEINDETSPFKGWSNAKICCYKVSVSDGIVTMMTPYVDSRMLDAIDAMGHEIDNLIHYKETKKAYYGEKEKTFYDVPIGSVLVTFSNYNGPWNFSRIGGRLVISFDTLEKETDVTIMIQ